MPFTEVRLGCPYCGKNKFHKRTGFHWFARFKCRHCSATFFRPKKTKQFAHIGKQLVFSDKKATVKYK